MILKVKSRTIAFTFLFLALFIAGCVRSSTIRSDTFKLDGECVEPRPELCTKDYRPVCALRDTGVRCITTPCPSTEWKTYSNACSACSDPDVMGYKNGACRDVDDAT